MRRPYAPAPHTVRFNTTPGRTTGAHVYRHTAAVPMRLLPAAARAFNFSLRKAHYHTRADDIRHYDR